VLLALPVVHGGRQVRVDVTEGVVRRQLRWELNGRGEGWDQLTALASRFLTDTSSGVTCNAVPLLSATAPPRSMAMGGGGAPLHSRTAMACHTAAKRFAGGGLA